MVRVVLCLPRIDQCWLNSTLCCVQDKVAGSQEQSGLTQESIVQALMDETLYSDAIATCYNN
jgi:hypothetical protein